MTWFANVERAGHYELSAILESSGDQCLITVTIDIEDAYRRLTRPDEPSLVTRNHALHKMLVDGVGVEYTSADGSIGGGLAR